METYTVALQIHPSRVALAAAKVTKLQANFTTSKWALSLYVFLQAIVQ